MTGMQMQMLLARLSKFEADVLVLNAALLVLINQQSLIIARTEGVDVARQYKSLNEAIEMATPDKIEDKIEDEVTVFTEGEPEQTDGISAEEETTITGYDPEVTGPDEIVPDVKPPTHSDNPEHPDYNPDSVDAEKVDNQKSEELKGPDEKPFNTVVDDI